LSTKSGLRNTNRQNAAKTRALLEPIEELLLEVEERLYTILDSPQARVNDVATHLLEGGGKRVRPALVLLCGSLADDCEGSHDALVQVAAAVELIHMATLVHDDIVDESELRRGVATVHACWDEQIAVLSGDYLFARAFTVLAETGENRVVRIMADVVSTMSVGEIIQLGQAFESQTEEDYLGRVLRKTAYFIAESCRLGAVVSGLDTQAEEALVDYGHGIGMSYQIIDDILDLVGSEEEFGKPVGSDLQAGLYTLPVLYALEHSSASERLRQLLFDPQLEASEVGEICEIVKEAGGIEHAYERASLYIERAQAALEGLNPSPARTALSELADFIHQRRY
jgi:heptaprenyl diphosphate synthase